MMQRSEIQTQTNRAVSLGKPMILGAVVALILISFFLFGAGAPKPEWSAYWMVKPLIMVPLAGALGGLFYHFMDHLRYWVGLNRIVAVIISLVVYIIMLWLGTVLGLNGTMWD